MTEGASGGQKDKRKERKKERKRKKDEKKKKRAEKKRAAADEAGKVKPPAHLAAIARCDDDALEAFRQEHHAARDDVTVERLAMMRDLVREAARSCDEQDEASRERLRQIQETLTEPP